MKMNFKKAVALLAALTVVAMAFGGCGGSKKLKIGVTQIAQHASLDNCRDGFIQGLAEAGYVDGENIEITYLNANNATSEATSIAQQFVTKKMDLVCAIATPSATACYAATMDEDIPLIFCAVSDPVAAKLVPEMGKAGKGVTGVSDLIPVEKQLDLIKAILPEATKIGILYNTSEPNSESQIATYNGAADGYGFEIITSGVTAANEISIAAGRLAAEVDCIVNLTDNLIVDNLPVVLNAADEAGIPVFGSEEEQVKNGCLASEGLDYVALGKQTGAMAARVLDGEDISKVGSEYVDGSKLTINMDVAEKLNITIPEELMERAEFTE